MAYKIEYILLIGILAFLLYHLLGSCNCNDGFSVGGCIQEIDSCSNKMVDEKLKNTPCNQLYEQNQFDEKTRTKCIVDTVNASNCVPTDILCDSDPTNPTNLLPISIDDIKKSKSGASYYINPNEILIILKSNGSQTLEIAGAINLYILGNIYIENGATLNINNLQVNYNNIMPNDRNGRDRNSAATIINNGELNISNIRRGAYIFYGINAGICKLTNNGIITFKGINKDSINSEKRTFNSMVTYNSIDITGTGEIIYTNAGIQYTESVNIDNTQTFNTCAIYIASQSLSFNKPLTLNMSGFYLDNASTDTTIRNITIDKSYMGLKSDFTSDNMTITDSNIKISSHVTGKLNSKNITMDDTSSIMAYII